MNTPKQIPIPPSLLKKAQEMTAYLEPFDKKLSEMFTPCFLNTIETTVKQLEDQSFFVITGDIPAMWLRDSTAQLKPYLPFAKEDSYLDSIIASVIVKQADYVNTDPYANAYNCDPRGFAHHDITKEHPLVWERKYEVDSLCSVIELGYEYYSITQNTSPFSVSYWECLTKIYETFRTEQHHDTSPYTFERVNPPAPTDTLPREGRGTAVGYTQMTWSGFRPSDDACTYGYLIPSNMMAVVALRHAAILLDKIYHDTSASEDFKNLANEIEHGIEAFGVVDKPGFGKIYAYETDGLGNYLCMDDANSPSLLAIPYLGYRTKEDPVYQNTRKFLLSDQNPFYFCGEKASGIGSPHTPHGYIWHISLIMQILTSNDPGEIKSCLNMIRQTDAGTGFMHESFSPDNPGEYTRPWFAWANTLFAQMLIELCTKDFFPKSGGGK